MELVQGTRAWGRDIGRDMLKGHGISACDKGIVKEHGTRAWEKGMLIKVGL